MASKGMQRKTHSLEYILVLLNTADPVKFVRKRAVSDLPANRKMQKNTMLLSSYVYD